jgi:hypothetical protein
MQTNNKLREALVKAEAVLDGIRIMVLQGQEYDIHLLDIDGALGKCRTALAAPLRNCDVGTAEEQAKRFDEFCHANRNAERCCGDCPAFRTTCDDCELFWAQMPYEEGGAK